MEDSRLLSALARASGWDNLDRCLRLCDIVTTGELLQLDESTLDRMEQFLRQRAARLTVDQRVALIGQRHADQPDKFRMAPAARARVLNTVAALRGLKGTGGLCITTETLGALGIAKGGVTSVNRLALDTVARGRFGPGNTRTLTTVNMKALGTVAKLPIGHGDPSPGQQVRSLAVSRNTDRNIFQRIDLLTNSSIGPNRSNQSSNHDNPKPSGTGAAFPFDNNSSSNSLDTARSKKNRKRQGAALARYHKARKINHPINTDKDNKENSKESPVEENNKSHPKEIVVDKSIDSPQSTSVQRVTVVKNDRDKSAFSSVVSKPEVDLVDNEKLIEIQPQWTNTPNLITSRFINSSKHNASRSSGVLQDPSPHFLSQLI